MRLIALLLFMLPVAAFADATPIYVWGHGEAIAEAFKAVSQLIDENGAELTAIAFVVGGTFVGFRIAGLQGKPLEPMELGKFPIIIILLQQVFLSNNLSTSYMLIDETTDEPYSVGELPLGLGESFYLFSWLQRSILMKMEIFYTTPDSISYRKTGLGFGMTLHDTISTAKPVNPALIMSYNSYVSNCLAPMAAKDSSYLITLKYSANLLNDMKVNEMFITDYYSSDGGTPSVEYCPNAWGKMQTALGGEAGRYLKQLAYSMGHTGSGSSMLTGQFADKAGSVGNLYFGMSSDANSWITQAMLANMYNQGSQTMSALMGINSAAMGFMPAYADRKAMSSSYTSGVLARKYLPIMQMVLIIVVISVSWILVLLAIATYNMQYARTLYTLIMTIFLWTIISSILNFIFDLQLVNALKNVSFDLTSGSYTLALKDALDETVGDKLALMGHLIWLVPVLSFALAKGSDFAFAGMFSSLGHFFGAPAAAASPAATDRSAPGGHSLFSNLGVTYVDSKHGSINEFAGGHTSVSRYNIGGEDVTGTIKTLNGIETVSAEGASGRLNATGGQINSASLNGTSMTEVKATVASATKQISDSLLESQTRSEQVSKASEKAYTEALNEAWRRDESGNFVNTDEKAAQMRHDFAAHIVKETANVDAFADKHNVSKEVATQLKLEAQAYVGGSASAGVDSERSFFGKLVGLTTGGKVEAHAETGGKISFGGNIAGTGKAGTSNESSFTMSAKEAERFMNNLTTSFSEANKFSASKADTYSSGIGGSTGESFRELQSAQQSYQQSVNKLTSAVEAHNLATSVQQSISGDRLNQYLQISGTRPDGTFSEGQAYKELVKLNSLVSQGKFEEIGELVNSRIGQAAQFGENSALYDATRVGINVPKSDGLSAPTNNLGLSQAQQQAIAEHQEGGRMLEGEYKKDETRHREMNNVQQVSHQTADTSNNLAVGKQTMQVETNKLNNSSLVVGAIGQLSNIPLNEAKQAGETIVKVVEATKESLGK